MSQKRVLVTGGSGSLPDTASSSSSSGTISSVPPSDHSPRKPPCGPSSRMRVWSIGDNLSFVAADLMSDEGWAQAVADVDFVLHVASRCNPGTSRTKTS